MHTYNTCYAAVKKYHLREPRFIWFWQEYFTGDAKKRVPHTEPATFYISTSLSTLHKRQRDCPLQ